MATAFDGLGLGQLGSERQYMHGGGETAKFLMGALLNKFLPKRETPLPESQVEDRSTYGVPPPSKAVEPTQSNETNPNEHPDTGNVMKDLGLTSFVTPNQFTPRNPSLDAMPMDAGIAPPTQMKLPQYGQGGGVDPATVLASLATLFG